MMSAHVSPQSLLISLIAADPKDKSADISSSFSPAAAAAIRWSNLENDLKRIQRYRDDWDGCGSSAPDSILVDAAISLLGKLRKDGYELPFRVALSPNGSIIIEWQSKGEYLEAEIASEYQIEWMHAINGRTPTHWTERLCTDVRSGIGNRICQLAPGAVVSVSGR
jgi:hypothetical protein